MNIVPFHVNSILLVQNLNETLVLLTIHSIHVTVCFVLSPYHYSLYSITTDINKATYTRRLNDNYEYKQI